MRSVSDTLREATGAPYSGEVGAWLLTVTHDDLAAPLRLSTDPTQRLSVDPLRYGTVSRGETYLYFPAAVTEPEESEGTPPAIGLTLGVWDAEVVALLRSVTTPAKMTLELVLVSDPDLVEVTYPDFDVTVADYGADGVKLSLTVDALASEPFPSGSFTPGRFPGLFG